jgi:hypothetical protein
LQPHSPATQPWLLLCVAQSVHAPPLAPHAVAAPPATQVPFAQHPPLHVWVGEHDVVQVLPLQA